MVYDIEGGKQVEGVGEYGAEENNLSLGGMR